MRIKTSITFVALALLIAAVAVRPTAAQDRNEAYENLQVLPSDILPEDLGETMLGFLRGLGLPRRAGEGCLHCHEGSLDVPRSEWDFASDAKLAKRTARRMVTMVRAINEEHLASLEERRAPALEVGCATCHAGRVDPRPLPDLLAAVYESDGAEGVVREYRRLHARYFGSDAYDFRVAVLANMARALAGRELYDDALAVSAANEETHREEPSARRVSLGLRVQRALDADGASAAMEEFDRMRSSEPEEVLTFAVLDGVGWRTFRLGRHADALVLLEANRAAFPEEYFTFEGLNEALYAAGEITRDEIVRRYEAWLQEHPGHAMAEAQLTNRRRN